MWLAGAEHNFVSVITSSLGRNVGRSQQSAPKHLVELEKYGFIWRIKSGRGISVRITPEGYSQLLKISGTLQASLAASPSRIEPQGLLVSGMSEGAYYMSLKGYAKQFIKRIGYVPFPGTLNVRLEKREFVESSRQFDALDGIMIDGFHDGVRAYGWVKCFPGTVNGTIPCHLIRLERTHHEPSIVEFIAMESIREAAGLKDGSMVAIAVQVSR